MPLQMSTRGLRCFCVAAKCLSFKHAAEQLFLTPSAVSHQIKGLEEQLGFDLFIRKTRAIELSRAGKALYHKVEPLLIELNDVLNQAKSESHNETLQISMPEFFASEIFIPKMSHWTAANPNINLQIETVKSGAETAKASDLSIVLSSTKPNAFLVQSLFALRYVPACNHARFMELNYLGKKALESIPLILHKARPWAWHQWAEAANIKDFNPKQIIQFDSMFGVARAAQQGLGIALAPMPLAQNWFKEKILVPLFEQELKTKDHYYLVSNQDAKAQPSIELLRKWLAEELTTKESIKVDNFSLISGI
ncbi:LysR substrate-binding domain-containing protein [Paraferrimonas sp. SM1919]|uniref:LysR substrate-binding domain-containing protein n=1 Tax=Paraferrimonas sp. SM1919 TaxID=2662263 RepID=UPI0013D6E1C4|nr:LysR substrate-binding domain-containing protein [Paraferrimonas sp. SM1919]